MSSNANPLLDIMEEWLKWWHDQIVVATPDNDLVMRTTTILTAAGRDVPMGDWVPLTPAPYPTRCPSCNSPKPDMHPGWSGCVTPCSDRWHDGRRRPEADPPAFGGA